MREATYEVSLTDTNVRELCDVIQDELLKQEIVLAGSSSAAGETILLTLRIAVDKPWTGSSEEYLFLNAMILEGHTLQPVTPARY